MNGRNGFAAGWRGLVALAAAALCGSVDARRAVPYGVVADLTRSEYGMREELLDLAQKGGLGYVRVDWDWRVCQPTRDAAFDFSRYDRLVEAAEARGVRLLPIVYGTPKWADPAWRNADAYAAFCRATVRRYGLRLPVLEIWNEQNIPAFWKDPDASRYVALLRKAHEAIKAENPQVRVAFGGTAGWAPDFIEACYKAGAQPFFDIMNVHPYTYPRPAEVSVPDALKALRARMARHGDAAKPIWFTEVGWPTHEASLSDPGGFVTAGLTVALGRHRPWRVIFAASMPDGQPVARGLADGLKAAFPAGSEVRVCGPRETVRRLAEGGWDAVVYPLDESFPVDTFEAVYAFVKAGGTIVELGGMPFWRAYRNLPDGGSSLANGPTDWNLCKRLHIHCDSWWLPGSELPKDGILTVYGTPEGLSGGVKQPPTGFPCVHFFTDRHLRPGDTWVPLVKGTNPRNGKDAVAVCVYRFDSDLKGAAVIGGIPSGAAAAQPVDERTQAAYHVRALSLSLACGVEGFFCYNLRAREADRFFSEDHFGLAHADLSPKPAWQAYRTFAQMRPPGSAQRTDEWLHDGLYCPQWTRPDGTACGMLWQTTGRRVRTLAFDGPGVTFADMMGKPVAGKASGVNAFELKLSDEPVYFTGARLKGVRRLDAGGDTAGFQERGDE